MQRFGNTHPIDFLRYFDVSAAISGDQLKRVARLRHEVYCEEMGYEPPVATRLETDHHDAHALHCLITHKASGRAAGCLRLICATDHALLALEEHCLHSLHLGYLQQLNRHREQAVEMSRLAVAPAFRRKPRTSEKTDRFLEGLEIDEHERDTFHTVWLAALFAAMSMSESVGRPHLYAMMDPALPRMLRLTGVNVQQAGDYTEYHGKRAAFFCTTEEFIAQLQPELIELFEAIRSEHNAAASARQAAIA